MDAEGGAVDASVEVSTAAKLAPDESGKETATTSGAQAGEPQPELPAAGELLDSGVEATVGLSTAEDAATPAALAVGFTVPTDEPASPLSQMMAQFQKLQAIAPDEREQMFAELPPEVRAAARVAVKLPPEAVSTLASAAVSMQNGQPPPPEAIGTAYVVFSQLPPESKAVMISQLPPQVSCIIVRDVRAASSTATACSCAFEQAHSVVTAFVAAPNITEESVVKMAAAVLALKDTKDLSSANPQAIAALQ